MDLNIGTLMVLRYHIFSAYPPLSIKVIFMGTLDRSSPFVEYMHTSKNGIIERAIHNLSESALKQLLHACARWPKAVHFTSWPYALRNTAILHNSLPVLEDGTSRLELFSSICVGSNMKHVHTFGCPVFALQNVLA
jgi:hypothetical protein